jgi:hypothetical protein
MIAPRVRPRTALGLVLTAAWVAIFALLLWFNWAQASAMGPNEWGDFLGGGLAAPLALFWLILGYFQQGKELRAQQEELSRQVEASQRQAAAAENLYLVTKSDQERQALQDRARVQPLFVVGQGRPTKEGIWTSIVNRGEAITDVKFEDHAEFKIIFPKPILWNTDQEEWMRFPKPDQMQFPFRFEIHYTDKLGERYIKVFEYQAIHQFVELPEAGAMASAAQEDRKGA